MKKKEMLLTMKTDNMNLLVKACIPRQSGEDKEEVE
jgi:hypothetical protein